VLNLLLVFSLALNLAFVGIWAHHKMYVEPKLAELEQARPGVPSGEGAAVRPAPAARESEEQRRLMRELARRVGPRLQELDHRVKDRQEHLLVLLADPEPNAEEIERCQAEIAEGRRRMETIVVRELMEISRKLPPERRRALLERLRGRAALRRRQMHPPASDGGIRWGKRIEEQEGGEP
jgi:uncharacterized membrane protein